jgi:hypothetical protein
MNTGAFGFWLQQQVEDGYMYRTWQQFSNLRKVLSSKRLNDTTTFLLLASETFASTSKCTLLDLPINFTYISKSPENGDKAWKSWRSI